MFEFVKNWFVKSPQESLGDLSVYKPEERIIYNYFNGLEQVKSDPMILYKKIMDKAADLDQELKVARSQLKDNTKAHTAFVNRIRGIFDIKPLDQGGLSEMEVDRLFDHFMTYCDSIKKNLRVTTTNSNTVSLPDKQPEVVDPTSNTSDGGSTESGPTTEVPQQ